MTALRWLMWTGIALACAGVVLGIMKLILGDDPDTDTSLAKSLPTLAKSMAYVLAGFGLAKLAMAAEGWATRGRKAGFDAAAAEGTIAQALGGTGFLVVWVGWRLAAGVLAILAAVWLMRHPAALDHLAAPIPAPAVSR